MDLLERYMVMGNGVRRSAAERLHPHVRAHIEASRSLQTTLGAVAEATEATIDEVLDAAATDYWMYVSGAENQPMAQWVIGLDGE